MKKIHKIISCVILVAVTCIAFFFGIQITDAIAQNLVTFFSVEFGFYVTSIAILYNSSYIKSLHKKIDKKLNQRQIHILKSYLLTSSYCSIVSITSIILLMISTSKDTSGILRTRLTSLALPFMDTALDLNLLLVSALLGIATLNIFYMLLLIHTIIDGMIEEAKK